MASIDRTRAIVQDGETYEGRIVPTERAEIPRDVSIGEDARVTGGAYGDEITVAAGGRIEESVLASTSIDAQECVFGGEIGTPGKIEASGIEVRGSVTGTHVSLSDSVVWGNVTGTEVHLEDCVVLGIVAAEKTLSLAKTTCYTFKSQTSATVEDASVILPQAIVNDSLELQTPLQVLAFEIGDETVDAVEDVELDRGDLVTQEGTRYLTLAPRVMDLSRVRDRIDDLESFLAEAVLHDENHDAAWLRDQLAVAN